MSKAVHQINLILKHLSLAIYLSSQIKELTEKYCKLAKGQEYPVVS